MLTRLLAVLLGAAPALAGQVVIVSGPSAGAYASLQGAIDASVDGDVLLVGPGAYPAFTLDGKGLALVAAPASNVLVGAPSVVRNVPAGRRVLLSGLQSQATVLNADALRLSNNAGHVRVQGGAWNGYSHPASATGSGFEGGDGIEITSSAFVTISACVASGGRGRKITVSGADGGPGGTALRIANSTVAVYAVDATGGHGGEGNWGGAGGHGLYATGATLFLGGSSFTGGNGANARGGFVAGDGGGGGSGCIAPSSNVRTLDNSYTRGAGGWAFGAGMNGSPGAAFFATSPVVYAGDARVLGGASVGADGAPTALVFAGGAHDVVYLRVQRSPVWAYGSQAIGPWLVPAAPIGDMPQLGVAAADGSLAASYAPRDVDPSRRARVDYLQAVAIDGLGAKWLSSPWHVLVFDDDSGPDCNANAVPDDLDIACGASQDLDFDGVPDECP